jgi:hypothetical protein
MTQYYSKTYLQSINKQIDVIISLFIHDLKGAAATGETSFICDSILYEQYNLSKDVVLMAFKKRFSGCEVTYQENWTFPDSRERILMKGIQIDWS